MTQNPIKEDIEIEKIYGENCVLDTDTFLHKNHFSAEGLSNKQAQEKLKAYGPNLIKRAKPPKWYHYFFKSLFSPFNSILMGIIAVLIYTDIILPPEPSYANITVIAILIIVSALLEFFEEYRSNKAAEKLKELVATTSTVKRGKDFIKVPMEQITVGDLVSLSAGDLIPADLRIIESKDLYVSQSSLTGESDSVKKIANSEIKNIEDIDSISDLDTLCFTGSNVVSGYAKGIVIKVGDDTYLGKIAHTLSQGKPDTAFQKGIKSVSKLLIRFMLIIIPLTFLVNAWKHNTLTAFTFAVAIAIGITPLLLPVILSSSLAKGAVRMSKKKTIVKKLDSVQSFGSMNILCTDKTGTLTEDKIVLEKYLDIDGNEDIHVLGDAYLNAYFQSGLKANIDTAVIQRAEKENITSLKEEYEKLDEIPFDFSRRRLSVVVKHDNDTFLITKGAVEEILNICSFAEKNNVVDSITNHMKENILKITKKLNEEGLRVVAVCKKKNIDLSHPLSVKDESQMTLTGFIGFLDPPKESAKEAIEKLNHYGIRVMVLTGDNAEVTKSVCDKVGIYSSKIVLGNQIDRLSDTAVYRLTKKVNIFAKLSPIQKARIVRILKQSENTVGYMGDGINDSPSLVNSDVGISVDSAVDIAKETADIILLEKDLKVLLDGVVEGRKTFANLLKYIKMAVSFNFGEVLSVLIASIFLPFLPITPIQLLVQSLLYDLGQLTLPFDNVDPEYLAKPTRWNMKSIKHFMFAMGPVSSIFDLIVFASLWFGFGLRENDVALFQTIWFSYGIVSNLVGLHIIRTAKIPFFQSNASKMVYASSALLSIIAIIVPYTWLGKTIGLVPLNLTYIGFILLIPIIYCFVALFAKKDYIKVYKEWI